MRVISYGGGVQSTALVVLATQGELGDVDAALFANVGDKSEHPDTLRYVREVAIPWAAGRGLAINELRRQKRDGSTEDLYDRLMKPGSRSVPIPVRLRNGVPGKRACTHDWKIAVVTKWVRAHGALKTSKAEVLIGFSWDEIERVGEMKIKPYETVAHPLIDRRLTRQDCKVIIQKAGLPVPPKSSCFFCPFHRPSTWARMRRDEPELFQISANLETVLNERRARLGRDSVYLTRFGKPLTDAIQTEQDGLDFGAGPGETCDDGYCWT